VRGGRAQIRFSNSTFLGLELSGVNHALVAESRESLKLRHRIVGLRRARGRSRLSRLGVALVHERPELA
jgi:hypothetical protein